MDVPLIVPNNDKIKFQIGNFFDGKILSVEIDTINKTQKYFLTDTQWNLQKKETIEIDD